MRRLFTFLLATLFATAVTASSLTLLGTSGAGGVALSPFAFAFVTSGVDTATATTYSEVTQSVGTDVSAPDHRYTVVAVGGFTGGTSKTVSSITICGVAGTSVIATAGNVEPSAFFIADTTGLGTTCTIATTFSGSMTNHGWGIWRMVNPTSSTAGSTNSGSWTASSTAMTLSVNIIAGGAAAGYANGNISAVRTFTWSGLTERFDAAVDAPEFSSHTGADGTTAGTPTAITVTPSAPINGTGISASWH